MTRNNTTYYYFYDGLGSVTDLTKASGELVEFYQYDVYGTPSATSTVGNRFLFTGREYDSETTLYHYRARTYYPGIGRFGQKDPIEGNKFSPLTFHPYTYVLNNPVNFIDPLGLFINLPFTDDWERMKQLVEDYLRQKYGNRFTDAEYDRMARDFTDKAKPEEARGMDPQGVNKGFPEKQQEAADRVTKRLEEEYEKLSKEDPQAKDILDKKRALDKQGF